MKICSGEESKDPKGRRELLTKREEKEKGKRGKK